MTLRDALLSVYKATPSWRGKKPGKLTKTGDREAHTVILGWHLGRIEAGSPGICGLILLSQGRGPFEALKITKEDLV